MALTKIDDVFLYTGFNESATISYQAKKWLDDRNIPYEFMHYGAEADHQQLFDALNTWWPDKHVFTDFPFVIYTEIHDDLSPRNYPKVCLMGLNNIMESNLVDLYKLGRS